MTTSEASSGKPGLFARLKAGLSRSTSNLSSGLTGIFTKKKLDAETIGQLEEALIRADVGAAVALDLAEKVAKGRYDKEISEKEVREILASEIAKILQPSGTPFVIDPQKKPYVVLVAGVNGTGKTTTIGKMAKRLSSSGS